MKLWLFPLILTSQLLKLVAKTAMFVLQEQQICDVLYYCFILHFKVYTLSSAVPGLLVARGTQGLASAAITVAGKYYIKYQLM